MASPVLGVEIMAGEAARARARLNAAGLRAAVVEGDFFGWLARAKGTFDCVVGNPPFIRYQHFPEPSRSRAMRLLTACGLKANKLTNIWVPFVVGAIARLSRGGRLGLVLPAELLQVSYAAQLRRFLADRFTRIEVVACNHLFFAEAEQEVVLLLAEGCLADASKEHRCRINVAQLEDLPEFLAWKPPTGSGRQKYVDHSSEKWLKYLLSVREIGLMRELRMASSIATLREHGHVDVGVVTGKNSFFVVSEAEIGRYGLRDHVTPLIGRSSQLRGAVLKSAEIKRFAKDGHRVFLFSANSKNGSLPSGVRRYVAAGESRGDHEGYKCSIRDPWYSVPAVWTPDAFLFRQIYDFPRVVLNRTEAASTDTIHRISSRVAPSLLTRNLYTHLTAASAEIEGRSYGGGVLELEPTEAERLLVPKSLDDGALSVDEIDKQVRAGHLADVLTENDERILVKGIGVSRRDCATLKRIWTKMRDRRKNRGRNGRT